MTSRAISEKTLCTCAASCRRALLCSSRYPASSAPHCALLGASGQPTPSSRLRRRDRGHAQVTPHCRRSYRLSREPDSTCTGSATACLLRLRRRPQVFPPKPAAPVPNSCKLLFHPLLPPASTFPPPPASSPGTASLALAASRATYISLFPDTPRSADKMANQVQLVASHGKPL